MGGKATTTLKKPRFRQSWSKYNLYNFSRISTPPTKTRTFFQQKWTAKSRLREYHSEHVREGQWEKMFSRRLKAVVPMNPAYLAQNDGSLESAGRGSGFERPPGSKRPQPIPYMASIFAPLERRLDTAIFRSLFASSARQARQFVIHGAVTVNGKKMIYPGYLLNPGDMFQVDSDMVMFATGAPKEAEEVKSEDAEAEDSEPAAETAASQEASEEAKQDDEASASETPQTSESEQDPREVLKSLLSQAKSILATSKTTDLSAKRKTALRGFSSNVKRQLSRSASSTILSDSLEAQFAELKAQLTDKTIQAAERATEKKEEIKVTEKDSPSIEEPNTPAEPPSALEIDSAATDLLTIHAALSLLHNNPIDLSKPYATPWTPRPYMSAFAFIPRYLEVNQKVCAAVYLRHPVARPGMAEVPSPYSEGTQSEAFAWYLRRR